MKFFEHVCWFCWHLCHKPPFISDPSSHHMPFVFMLMSDQMINKGSEEKQHLWALRKINMLLESSQMGVCVSVAGCYEMSEKIPRLGHIRGTFVCATRSSGSQLFSTIYYTLFATDHVTLVLPEHVRRERSKKTLIKNNVRFWSEIKSLWVPCAHLKRWNGCSVLFTLSGIPSNQEGFRHQTSFLDFIFYLWVEGTTVHATRIAK